ncbi:MAG: M20 family metallopeptidase [Oscillochloridaceae bacterium umkhey_bin13]
MRADRFAHRRADLLALAQTLVAYDTPSGAKAHCDTLADLLATRLADLGQIERFANPAGGDHLALRVPAPQAPTARPTLILCHYDTVWPLGTAAARPLQIEGDTAFGPGLYDMKVSIALTELALRELGPHGLARPVTFLLTSDEEIGSPTSRELIEREARASAHVLVLEPPVEPHGALKTARKGIGAFTVRISGRAAHAGVEPEKGASAITELAHQVLAINALADPALGTTLNVGIVHGGSGRNVVPAEATLEIDARAWRSDEANRVTQALYGLVPQTPGVHLATTGSFSRPPMERTPASLALFAQAQHVARDLDLELSEGSTGGGSDGNFTAAVGTPTLDGLGAPGQGAHATYEQISISGALQRLALLVALLTGL